MVGKIEKETMEKDNLEDMRDFQTPSSLDPGLERIIKANSLWDFSWLGGGGGGV